MAGDDLLLVQFGGFFGRKRFLLVLEAAEHGEAATGHDPVHAFAGLLEEPVFNEFAHESDGAAHASDALEVEGAVERVRPRVYLVVAPRHHRRVQSARGHAAVLHRRIETEGAVEVHRHGAPPSRHAIIDL